MQIRWTPQFRILVVLGLFMLWAAINYSNNGAYFVLFLLISVVVTSGFMAWGNMRGAALHWSGEAQGHVHSDCCLPVRVVAGADRILKSVSLRIPGVRVLGPSARIDEISPPGRHCRLLLPVSRRGVYQIDEIVLESTFPLGFWYCRKRFPVEGRLWVYPEIKGSLPWPEYTTGSDDSSDESSGQSGDIFSGHRRYTPGESQRHIDWKAFSRGKGLLIKDYRGGGTGCVVFDYSSLVGLDGESRLSQLAQWALQASREDVEYLLRLPGREVGPGCGASHYQQVLKALTHYQRKDADEVALAQADS